MNYVYIQYIEMNWSVLVFQELSAILSRLDKIESKLDILLQSGSSFQPLPPTPTPTPISRSETPSPAAVKEVRREWIKSSAIFKGVLDDPTKMKGSHLVLK